MATRRAALIYTFATLLSANLPARVAYAQAPTASPAAVAAAQAPTAPAGALALPVIVGEALATNPAARAAQQRLVQAQARLAETSALRAMQPVFTGSVGGSNGQVAQPVSTQNFYTATATVTIPIPNGAATSSARDQARAQLDAAQAGLDRARQDLAFQASQDYYGVLRTRGARDIAADSLAQAQRQVADTQKRVDAGDLPQAEVLKAQVPEAAARVALARAETAARIAEQTLNSVIVRDLAAPVILAPAPALAPLTMTREQAEALALQRSPDVREARANLVAAEAAVRSARHAHDPDFSIQGSHVETSDITAYSSLSTVTLNMNLPIGIGRVAREQVHQAQAQEDQARQALVLAEQSARLEVDQAYLDVQTGEANVTATQETVRIAQDSLEKARQSFLAGLTNTRDVLDAQLALAQSRNDANTAVYDLAVARARLDQATAAPPIAVTPPR